MIYKNIIIRVQLAGLLADSDGGGELHFKTVDARNRLRQAVACADAVQRVTELALDPAVADGVACRVVYHPGNVHL